MSIAEFNYSTLITLSCSSLSISFNWSFSVLISVPTFFIFCSCKWWKKMIQFLSMMTSEFSFASAKIVLVETRFHILNMLSSFLTWKYIKVLLKQSNRCSKCNYEFELQLPVFWINGLFSCQKVERAYRGNPYWKLKGLFPCIFIKSTGFYIHLKFTIIKILLIAVIYY